MMADKKTRVFLDASVFIAAAGSKSGGSSLVSKICSGLHFSAVVSRKILLEAQINIRKKLPSEALLRFYKELDRLNPEVIEPLTKENLNNYNNIISTKDRHVLAGAIESKAGFLITLDRKHFKTEAIRKANLPVKIMTPGEFLEFVVEKYS
ncbi:MAG: putative toxin-antitoxin system toxin component, PIN family [Actinomycetota bacterium]|nr:putative toxin-antitoxin system toxin component, PIN family [Actinomycetota bacterium]